MRKTYTWKPPFWEVFSPSMPYQKERDLDIILGMEKGTEYPFVEVFS